MKSIKNVLRDRTVNNLIVAVIIGYSVVNFIQFLTLTVGMSQGGPGTEFWVRSTVAFVASLALAWVVSWFAE